MILIEDKGCLSYLRDVGLHAGMEYVTFIDDDVYCYPTFVAETKKAISKKGTVGVSGSTYIPRFFRRNRDLFKLRLFRLLHNALFVDGRGNVPGYLSSCGAPSYASSTLTRRVQRECEYLDACNFTVKRHTALAAGGFSREYTGTSEWCEIDLARRLADFGKLQYNSDIAVLHFPSKKGVYAARLQTAHRWHNFMRFQKTYVKTSWRSLLYRVFVWAYLTLKQSRLI